MSNLYLDIETIPAPEEEVEKVKYLYEKMKAKRAKRNGYEDDPDKYSFADYLKNTGFDGAFGRIICIAYAIDDAEVKVISHPDNEKLMLKEFWEIAKNIECFVGYNLMDFDMRFIWQRSVKLKVQPTIDLNFARYRNTPMYDVMKEWSKWGSQKDPGLETVALALGLESPKSGIDGSMVWDFFKAGKIDEICEYCKRDVDTTREIYYRMTFRK